MVSSMGSRFWGELPREKEKRKGRWKLSTAGGKVRTLHSRRERGRTPPWFLKEKPVTF